MASEIQQLHRRIKATEATLNSVVNFIETYVPSSRSIQRAVARLNDLPSLFNRFEECQRQLEEVDEENIDTHISFRVAFHEKYLDASAELQLIVEHHENESATKPPLLSSTVASQMKLPAVPAPKFSGNVQEWTSFIDSFNALFHSNEGLANVQKFHYLKSCLTDSASDVVKTIPTTGENYEKAYNALVNRYENKGLIIQSHIRSLLDAPKVQNPSASGLQALHHHIVAHVRALEALQQPVIHWDAWLITLVCSRLDSLTASEWQLRQKTRELPRFKDIELFLMNRIAAYEAGNNVDMVIGSRDRPSRSNMVRGQEKRAFFAHAEWKPATCQVCSGQHKLYGCAVFKGMPVSERKNVVSTHRLCFNCLNFGHQVKQCKFSHCSKCSRRHNTLLHEGVIQGDQVTPDNTSESSQQPICNIVSMCASHNAQSPQGLSQTSSVQVILPTAVFYINDKEGTMRQCRAILDSGSQISCLTQPFVRQCNLNSKKMNIPIRGLGASHIKTVGVVTSNITSRFGDFDTKVDFHIVPGITNLLPSQAIQANTIKIPSCIQDQLADPHWNQPGEIDALLGADVFFDLFYGEKVTTSDCSSLHRTTLGWIVTGKLWSKSFETQANGLTSRHGSVPSIISLLNTKIPRQPSNEEVVENHFKENVYRDETGRFVVKLPLSKDPSVLGNSKYMAEKRFLNIERKLQQNKQLANEYRSFMKEYVDMKHMVAVNSNDQTTGITYYLPHHAVIKSNSLTTKTRIVFDGSALTTSGLSLNDILMCGPTVQPTLLSILLRFRTHAIAVTADIEKMYRQILVNAEDCNLQRILYRSQPTEPLQEYKLSTVTYGTKSAPFLATRCLVELANCTEDEVTAKTIKRDFYVDDLMSGGSTVDECYRIYTSVTQTLSSARMPIRKWCSNSQELMARIPMSSSDPHYLLTLSEHDSVSTLGIMWQPSTDSFLFATQTWSSPRYMTKRTMLSDINRIYDPLGFISPVLITGKIFVQQLWALKLDWDTILPQEIQEKWKNYYCSLHVLHKISIPRKVICEQQATIQLHGFSDASQEAFGACIYVRTMNKDSTWTSMLYTSKSRVAPMRPTTIPRLELCAALLLAELITDVLVELEGVNIHIYPENIFLWSDSSIVITWLNSNQLLKSYVSNRVGQVLELTKKEQWRHVSTKHNPADLISRGTPVETIIDNSLWWHGPQWLNTNQNSWPKSVVPVSNVPEIRTIKLVLTAVRDVDTPLLTTQSRWMSLVRITAYVRRFIQNTRIAYSTSKERQSGPLTVHELHAARLFWFHIAQQAHFHRDVIDLKAGRQVSRSSKLKTLNPYIDDDGLIRVGGRLAKSSLPHSRKCPIVLPYNHKVTQLLFKYEHERLLHAGPRALLAHIHRTCWPLRGKCIARTTVHKCITCFRSNPKLETPLMAPLPKERVTVERAFNRSGVDFCGPIYIKSGIRRVAAIKCYIAVFVCFVTRAVHLELVTNLTTEAFMAALTRFMSRRGMCTHIHSDNGTNFVGASKVLKQYAQSNTQTQSIPESLATYGVQWHFTPPSAPHFGGLWEAAVKSAKHHLLRATKGALLSFEEMTTLLCKIEAILNSRPLVSISDDPNDHEALTPSHFLTGGPAILPQEPDVSTVPITRLRRFELMKAQLQTFWKRWSQEYLPQLQTRGRWASLSRKVEVGNLAILKEDNVPPMRWKLVRIVAVHPGTDGVVRVVTVRLSSGTELKRPMVKLALLPNANEDGEDTSV